MKRAIVSVKCEDAIKKKKIFLMKILFGRILRCLDLKKN